MGFPEGFWWGTAASSTQAEGSAPRSTWRRWEHLGRVPPSGDGNGFSTRYPEDFARLADYGLSHHRLSLEWARIEPEEGRPDPAAIDHYRAMLTAARDAGIEIWACLHHFSLPGWFGDDRRGFLDEDGRQYFWPRHVEFVAETFGDLISGWMPINEPVAYAAGAYLSGQFPPGHRSIDDFAEALEATLMANHEAWRLLCSGAQPVATVMNLSPSYVGVQSRRPDEREAAQANTRLYDDVLFTSWIGAVRDGILAVPGRNQREVPEMVGAFDLIGFSYYHAHQVFADLSTGPYPTDALVGPLGYAPWPEGLGIVLRRLADELPGRALVVAELGFGTDDDQWRCDLMRDSLREVERAIDDGIDVRGVFHWTDVDNYEWEHGFDVQFGLFSRDREPKSSAELARAAALG